jgi:hypothetical protein
MKTTKKLFGILLVSLFILSSCGKYEEGPAISLLPKSTRLSGTWKVEKLFYDGVENEVGFALVQDMELTLESDGTGEVYIWGFDGDVEWEFTSNKENFNMRSNMGTGWGEWYESKILRLTMSEFWVSETDDDGTEVHTTETHYVKQ